MTKHQWDRLMVLTLLSLAFLAATVGIGMARGDNGTIKPKDRIPHGLCFPASHWDGSERTPDSLRPCAQIVRVEEDGSTKIRVSERDGTVRFTVGVGAPDV